MSENMLELVKKVLEKDDRLISGNTLLKNKIMELTYKQDEKLIELLLSKEKIKKYFFTEVNSTLIFDKDKFVKFVNNKQFLPDSYTTFKNKIGLTENGEYIDKKKEVCLSWPYKDCVLEGDQADPDEKRDEIFWNEILAPDEVDRLLDPKVLTNFKRINKEKEKKEVEINKNDNLLIKGNNLLVLHSLKKKYYEKIKLIYIDPPYNRERGTFNYNDNFNHSTWLTFMKNRLKVAKKLLKKDGAIIVSCDDNEQAYLKVLMDEIFDKDNFLLNGVVNRSSQTAKDNIVSMHEYFLVYTKNKNEYSPNGEKRYTISRGTVGNENQTMPVITFPAGLECKDVEDGVYKKNRNIEGSKENIKNLDPIIVKDGVLKEPVRLKARWRSSNDMRNFFNNNCKPTVAKINGVIDKIYFKGDRFMPQIRKKIIEKIPSLITDNKRGSKDLEKLKIEDDFDYPKYVDYIKQLINYIASDDDIVLDFFAGSGTTAQAILELNKEENNNIQFILCEQLDYINSITKKRIKKVIEKSGYNNDFIYTELMEWNQKYIKQIKAAESEEALIDIWNKMKEEAFLSYKVDPKEIDENIEEFKELNFEDKKKFLFECLDKNHLYANLSEIDDEEYNISQKDKELNKQFFGDDLNA